MAARPLGVQPQLLGKRAHQLVFAHVPEVHQRAAELAAEGALVAERGDQLFLVDHPLRDEDVAQLSAHC